MIKALLVDFFGTLVYEDGAVVRRLAETVAETGDSDDLKGIIGYWWDIFSESFHRAHGADFVPQRELEYRALCETVQHFHSAADARALSEMLFANWMRPPIFPDSTSFLDASTVPVYIVSNIDRTDIESAIAYHGFTPAGVFTSEDARSYKPRGEIFRLALDAAGVAPDEVLHIGDSLESDVQGASSLGIHAVWLNRGGKPVPAGVTAVGSLMDVYKLPIMNET